MIRKILKSELKVINYIHITINGLDQHLLESRDSMIDALVAKKQIAREFIESVTPEKLRGELRAMASDPAKGIAWYGDMFLGILEETDPAFGVLKNKIEEAAGQDVSLRLKWRAVGGIGGTRLISDLSETDADSITCTRVEISLRGNAPAP